MKKEDTKKFEELSLQVFNNKHAYKKLMNKGIVYNRNLVNPKGPSRPSFIARRQRLTPEGVFAYMEKTLEMQEKTKQEMGAKDNAGK